MNNSIKISCKKENLKIVRNFVTDYLHPFGLSDVVLNQIILAVDEIAANLIIHANNEDNTKFLKLTILDLTDTFVFELTDQGKSFNPENYTSPDLEKYKLMGKKGGVGIALVKRIMDKVEYMHDGENNICRLYKKIK